MMIGTVLPTRASLDAGDRYAGACARRRLALARASGLLSLDRRDVGGETRYYTPDGRRYSIVSQDGYKILQFELFALRREESLKYR